MISIILENNLNVLSRKSFCIVLGHLQAMQYVQSNLNDLKLQQNLKIRNFNAWADTGRASGHGPCQRTRAPVSASASSKLQLCILSWHGPCQVTRVAVSGTLYLGFWDFLQNFEFSRFALTFLVLFLEPENNKIHNQRIKIEKWNKTLDKIKKL